MGKLIDDGYSKEEFLDEPDLKLMDVDSKNTINTNFYIDKKNYQTITDYLKKMKKFLIYLYELIDLDYIVQQVLIKLETDKNDILLKYSQPIGSTSIQKINNRNFQLKKIDSYTIEISNLTDKKWITDRLIVMVKNIDGIQVYPTIITKNSVILIHFSDEVGSNYNILFM